MRQILKMASIATLGMTLFSIMAGKFYAQKFFEPAVLNMIFHPREKKNQDRLATGYVLHTLIGLIFSFLYKLFWDNTGYRARTMNSMLLGLVNGLAGISAWHALFQFLHRPAISIKKYYSHLLAAHLVFGFLNGLVYKRTQERITGDPGFLNG